MEIGGGVQFTAGMNVTGIFSKPDAPTSVTASRNGSLASPGDLTSATVTFVAPTQPFGVDAQISTYTATSNPGSITGTINQSIAGPITVSGLTSTTNYTFTVTATNRAGTSPSSSASSSIGSLPLNTVAPAVTGTTTVGQTLTTTTGTWTGSPTPTYTYQWQRAGSDISGATSSTYTLVSSDAGNTIRCVVTASNSTGAVAQNSNSTTAINWIPINTVAPVVSGTTQVGYTLSTTTGTWTGYPTPTYAYQWQRAGVNIAGATSSTYTLVSSDAGNAIRCVVTATNVLGSVSANSNSTSAIVWQPINTVAPAVTGTPVQGYTLTTTSGTWTGYPTPTYTYQWQSAGVDIAGATSSTYVLTSSDLGNTVRCVVTGTNSVTSVSANSNNTATISSTPVNTVAPAVTGTASVGQTLTTTSGTWTGTPTPTYTYQWQRAEVDISSATNNTYTLVDADAGSAIRCVVTASNTATSLVGVVTANSNSTSTVTGPPVNYVVPVISGSARLGLTLTCSTGSWYGYPTISYTYQWQRDGSDISGETSNTYVILSADVTKLITCIVTATNTIGTATVTTNSVTPSTASYSVVSDGGTGTKGYIGMASNSAYALSNYCTIEFWIRLGSGGTINVPEVLLSAANTNNPVQFLTIDASNRIGIGPLYTPAGVGLGAKSVSSLTRNSSTWYHVAIVLTAGTLKLYVNGTSWSLTGTTTGWNATPVTTSMRLFNYGGGGNYYFKGTLSNMRITNNVLYTGNFTPPTTSLTTSSVGTTGANVYAGSLGSDVVFLGLNTTNLANDDSGIGALTAYNTSFIRYSTSNPFTEIPPGEQVYTTAGTYTWVVPANVNEIAVVAVGGGESGRGGYYYGSQGGDGGYLAYRNSITVTPGNSYTVVVGAGGAYAGGTKNAGGNSYISLSGTTICLALGGGQAGDPGIAEQVSYRGGSGDASAGGGSTQQNVGGGGAGGYAGIGGIGGSFFANTAGGAPAPGSGGGRGGAYGNDKGATGGGGVGIFGLGSDGTGSGGGGSGGTNGTNTGGAVGGDGGNYGGGGGGGDYNNLNSVSARSGVGGGGAVRIIWPGQRAADTARAFPSTLAVNSTTL